MWKEQLWWPFQKVETREGAKRNKERKKGCVCFPWGWEGTQGAWRCNGIQCRLPKFCYSCNSLSESMALQRAMFISAFPTIRQRVRAGRQGWKLMPELSEPLTSPWHSPIKPKWTGPKGSCLNRLWISSLSVYLFIYFSSHSPFWNANA